MNAAKVETSPRLSRMLSVLKAHPEGLTTMELQSWTNSCAVATDISEIRRSNYIIERQFMGVRNGRKVNRYRYKGRAS